MRRPLIATLHGALFQLSVLRGEMNQLRHAAGDAPLRLFSDLDAIEARALRLIDDIERNANVPSH